MPDYRITCPFVDRTYRRPGTTAVAVSYNAIRSMEERLGFTYERGKGKGNCSRTKLVPAA